MKRFGVWWGSVSYEIAINILWYLNNTVLLVRDNILNKIINYFYLLDDVRHSISSGHSKPNGEHKLRFPGSVQHANKCHCVWTTLRGESSQKCSFHLSAYGGNDAWENMSLEDYMPSGRGTSGKGRLPRRITNDASNVSKFFLVNWEVYIIILQLTFKKKARPPENRSIIS